MNKNEEKKFNRIHIEHNLPRTPCHLLSGPSFVISNIVIYGYYDICLCIIMVITDVTKHVACLSYG